MGYTVYASLEVREDDVSYLVPDTFRLLLFVNQSKEECLGNGHADMLLPHTNMHEVRFDGSTKSKLIKRTPFDLLL